VIPTVVGVYVLKDGKLLMVQEAREDIKGMWNFPAGKLELGENVFDAAVREAKEETGYDVRLTGFLGIQNCVGSEKEPHRLHIGFAAEIIRGGQIDPREIMSVQFIDAEKVLQMTAKELRGAERKESVANLLAGKILPLDVISNYNNGVKKYLN